MIGLRVVFAVVVGAYAPAAPAVAAERPVQVFILAGQSNMQGHGVIEADPARNGGKGSLEHLVNDPATAAGFRYLLDDNGGWATRDDVWIHDLDRKGRLTVGYGAEEDRIGPELGFGHVLGDALEEPVLLIKLAWGGKSLGADFRPPGAGGAVGPYYREIVERTKAVLDNLATEFPEFGDRGYELAGFGWHQGWNDRIDPEFNDAYEANLAHFIRDIRRDLGVKDLPFVIAETGMTGPRETHPRALSLMKAQAAVAEYDEFAGTVAFVGTRQFWRDADVSPTSQDYHWNSNAETYTLIGEAMGTAMAAMLRSTQPAAARALDRAPLDAEMAGYLLVPHERVEPRYNAGFSLYVAAWPLLKQYPGQDFQSGLFGTWMFAQYDGPTPENLYSDIEGGLGWWRDTRFATETPKFIMGGVALNFDAWANGPGAGKGRDWSNPKGHYAIAQLSPRVLWPPDGLNLKQGTRGELFGYGYLPLPLTEAKNTTAGVDVPTGNQCWTLFLNTGNFKGPVAFFLPEFWSRPSAENPKLGGLFLDTRPSEPNKALQMETQHIPAAIAHDPQGATYARVAPTLFPGTPNADSVLVHRLTAYGKAALWDAVQAWFAGGPPANGAIDPRAAAVHTFQGGGGATWRLYPPGAERDQRGPLAWKSFATPVAIDAHTFGYRWNHDLVSATDGALLTLPEYYRLENDDDGHEQWVPIPPADVPAETGLARVAFPRGRADEPEPYVTPEEPDSPWKTPGPAAGPFEAELGDGSVVTYYWYRFADQPALRNADLTDAERERLQERVEKLHRAWTKDRDYLPPPTIGTLADLDPAVLVTPPSGLEYGYVPIVTRQAAQEPGAAKTRLPD